MDLHLQRMPSLQDGNLRRTRRPVLLPERRSYHVPSSLFHRKEQCPICSRWFLVYGSLHRICIRAHLPSPRTAHAPNSPLPRRDPCFRHRPGPQRGIPDSRYIMPSLPPPRRLRSRCNLCPHRETSTAWHLGYSMRTTHKQPGPREPSCYCKYKYRPLNGYVFYFP
jgi:hypothetical protein